MPKSPKLIEGRADKIIGGWKKSAATKSFGELTVAQYEALRQATTTAYADVTTAEATLTEVRNILAAARETLDEASSKVVNGVRGDQSVGGDNGSLYEAMGYVRKDEKSSGLTRRKATTPAKPAT